MNATVNATARRVTVFHEVAQRADWTNMELDAHPLQGAGSKRALRLAKLVGEIAGEAVRGDYPRDRLVRLAGDALAWIEEFDAKAAQ